jgi:glycogen(starch) synthase
MPAMSRRDRGKSGAGSKTPTITKRADARPASGQPRVDEPPAKTQPDAPPAGNPAPVLEEVKPDLAPASPPPRAEPIANDSPPPSPAPQASGAQQPPAAVPTEEASSVARALMMAEEAPPPRPTPPAIPQPPLLFECAWEVCWQLGGIYTVLKTKAAAMIERWGDRYCLIGPYNPQTSAVEFEEQPTYGSIREALQRLKDQLGLQCYFGRWLIPGRPRVILVDYRSRYGNLDHDKYLLWEDHRISTQNNDGEVNEVVAFGFAVAEFFRVFREVVTDRPILAHFHEWMGAVAVPRIAHMKLPLATVFTTHATLLGRYLASDNPFFYDHLPFLDPDKEAAKFNIYPRFAIERAAAHAATVFTTVSEVTAREAEKLLGRRPEGILPNGLNIHRFAAPHEFQHLHQLYKQRIHDFVMGHFFPSYTFDLDRTVYLFTSGRYEYRNKGMDLYIEALHRLNQRLKQHVTDPPTVVAFIITKAMVKHPNVDVLKNHSMFEDLRNTCADIRQQMGERLFHSAATGRLPTYAELLPDDAQVRLKRAMHAWRTSRQPLIVTHDLVDDANDPTLKHLRHRRLLNAADDPVKIVFHPEFVTATSPTISLDYEQFVRGCHMGIFPSYYEPWGYTPMECVALGLPSVTTDLSGFGAYVQRHVADNDEHGIVVLPRREAGFEQSAEMLADYLTNFVQLTRRQRIELRNRVERMGELFDWSALARHYDEAHSLALERVGAPRMGRFELKMV